MNAEMLSMDPIVIEKPRKKQVIPSIRKTETISPEPAVPANPRFGSIDLWKIRRAKKRFTYYR